MKMILITTFGLLLSSYAQGMDTWRMTQEEFLTHVNEVAKASTTETEFPELAPSRVRTFARFGIPGDEFKKNELVIYARTTGTATPVRKYDYGILGAPIISHSPGDRMVCSDAR